MGREVRLALGCGSAALTGEQREPLPTACRPAGGPWHSAQLGPRPTRQVRKLMSRRSNTSIRPTSGWPKPALALSASLAAGPPPTAATAPKSGAANGLSQAASSSPARPCCFGSPPVALHSCSTWPSLKRKIRSANRSASERLCVMCRIVTPVCARTFRSRSPISARVSSSSALSGSSRQRMSGRNDSARPRATRCASPPLSPGGRRPSKLRNPSQSTSSLTRC